MLRVLAIYPNVDGSHFDGDDYVHRHAPLARSLLAPRGLKALRILLGSAALDGTAPPYWAIGEMIFADRAAFDEAMALCGAALFADAVNYTNVAPVLQSAELATDQTR